MPDYTIFPIGDSAITIDLGNYISEPLNEKVISMQYWLQQNPFDGLIDVIVAYSSLSVIFDATLIHGKHKPEKTVFEFIARKLKEAYSQSLAIKTNSQLVRIPVCYHESFAYDLPIIAHDRQLTTDEVIAIHTAIIYRVYLIGFLPGFPYMASVDERIRTPRKEKPRQIVEAGSVALAGDQTGIYPLDSPGGWQVIGRTPMKMFDKAKGNSFYVKAGDRVQFCPISLREFNSLSG